MIENKNQLPNDLLLLAKLKLVKEETIENFKKEINKMDSQMKKNKSPINSKLELQVSRVEFEFQNNEHELNYARLNFDDFSNRAQDISRHSF